MQQRSVHQVAQQTDAAESHSKNKERCTQNDTNVSPKGVVVEAMYELPKGADEAALCTPPL
jgi:hypothetical protein